MKKEISQIAQTIKDDTKIYSFWSEINMDRLISNLSQAIDSDAPDAFLELDNVIYLIEHFKLSAYHTNRKGDSLQEALNTARNTCLTAPTINNLVENFMSTFSSHSKKFNNYFQKAKEAFPNKCYKLILLIEDTSYAILSASNEPYISILNIDKINSALYAHPQVDGVIVTFSPPCGTFLVSADKQGLKKIKNYPLNSVDIPAYVSSLSKEEQKKIMNYFCSILEKNELTDSVSVKKFNTKEEYILEKQKSER